MIAYYSHMMGPQATTRHNPPVSRSSRPAPARGPYAHDQVYETLKRAILGAYFRPGERITIRSLAAQLNTSDTPVREALKRLVAERAIVATSDRKFEIPVLSRDQVEQILELRMVLEGLAAAQAAERITGPELARVRQEFEAMEEAVKQRDPELLLAVNTRFHFLIYRASGNDVLVPMIESLWLQYAPTLAEYLPYLMGRLSPQDQRRLYKVSQEQHKEVLLALEKRDGAGAREQIEADLRIFRDAAETFGHDISAQHQKQRTVADYADLLP